MIPFMLNSVKLIHGQNGGYHRVRKMTLKVIETCYILIFDVPESGMGCGWEIHTVVNIWFLAQNRIIGLCIV